MRRVGEAEAATVCDPPGVKVGGLVNVTGEVGVTEPAGMAVAAGPKVAVAVLPGPRVRAVCGVVLGWDKSGGGVVEAMVGVGWGVAVGGLKLTGGTMTPSSPGCGVRIVFRSHWGVISSRTGSTTTRQATP